MSIIASTPASDRTTRGAFVRAALKSERWSIRAASMAIGMSHSALSDRCNGRAPFLAEDIESIAGLLKRDPVEFYGAYLRGGDHDADHRTLVPKIVGWGHASVAQGIEHWFPVPGVARSNRVGGAIIPFPTRDASGEDRDRLAPVTPITRRAS